MFEIHGNKGFMKNLLVLFTAKVIDTTATAIKNL